MVAPQTVVVKKRDDALDRYRQQPFIAMRRWAVRRVEF
jgi:hypothetical protein